MMRSVKYFYRSYGVFANDNLHISPRLTQFSCSNFRPTRQVVSDYTLLRETLISFPKFYIHENNDK